MILYEVLKTPKSTTQVYEAMKEYNVNWTKEQLELYLLLDPNTKKEGQDSWSVLQDDRRAIVLKAIDKALTGKKVAKISQHIMPNLPGDLIITPAEIVEIAESTGRFDAPRQDMIRRK